jgi:hypothetical protein
MAQSTHLPTRQSPGCRRIGPSGRLGCPGTPRPRLGGPRKAGSIAGWLPAVLSRVFIDGLSAV